MEENREKLKKAIKSLDQFKDILTKSNQQTKSMTHILSHFDERLSKLEETIQPVYKETGNLQTQQENIAKTLERLDYVIKFYTIANEVEATVTAGLGSDLNTYLEKLDKLREAVNYFEHNNPESPELMNVTGLYEKGGNCIEKEFRQLLSRHCIPVPPVIIFDLVNEEDNPNAEKTVLEQLPEKTKRELALLGEWLCHNRNDDFITVYANLRSEVLVKSLQSLRDHQKSGSGGISSNIQGSPAMTRKNMMVPIRETPPRRTTPKSIQQALKKKLQDVIPGDFSGSKSSQTTVELKDEISIGEKEIVGYLTIVTALYKLMQSELKLMNGIIPFEHQKPIFSRLVFASLESVVGEGESLANRVKKCIMKQDFSSALSLFPILRHQASMRHNFDILFDGCTLEVQSKFQGLVVALQATIARSLEEFVEYIKSDQIHTKVPKDGTVHELTSNVMIFLVQLLGYLDILSRVITVSDLQSLENSVDKNRYAFAQYINRVLSSLGLTLQNKSEGYTDPHLKAMFKLNNLHYILKTLRKSGLLRIVHLYNHEIEEVYEDQMMECKRIYSQSWSRVLHFVLEIDKPLSQQRTLPEMNQMASMKLKDKDRQNIKDKFSGFNKEIEEIHKIQKGIAIPDPELKEQLKKDNEEFIVPKYQLFYDKYININFTKNPEKYIKYTPQQVAHIINSFFDSAA